MTLQQILFQATKKLSNSDSPSLDSEVLLSFLLQKPKEYLLVNPNRTITGRQAKQLAELIAKRAKGWPVAYLTKQKEFFGLKFFVDKNVLIPRPETEQLVELVLSSLTPHASSLRVLDLGTGSGAIIVALAKNLSRARLRDKFFASDVSPKALAVAKGNAKNLKVKIEFKLGSLLSPWKNQHFDIIVANLPYLAKQTDPSTKFEPKHALVAKKQGLALYEELFKQIPTLTPLPSSLFFEIGHDQGAKIKNLATKLLPASPAGGLGYKLKILTDLSRRVRYAVLSLK